jgi:protein arginine kinase activator
MKCDYCDKPAVVHEVSVKGGVKKETHLCAHHAKELGIEVATQPINQLLTHFVFQQAGKAGTATRKACPECGMTWTNFRQTSLLGCPKCYDTFEQQLGPLIERAQHGALHHVGKSPTKSGGEVDRQLERRQLLKQIKEAVAAEQYERAAKLRDRLSGMDAPQPSASIENVPRARAADHAAPANKPADEA